MLAEGLLLRRIFPSSDVHDEIGRFKTWAVNTGAFLPASNEASLDHRLREATLIRDHHFRILKDLHQTLVECKTCIISLKKDCH